MQKIQYLPIDQLKENPDNPRLIEDGQFDIFCESVRNNPDYFETRPVLCGKDFVIFAGTMRYRAAKIIGLKQIPVAVMDIPKKRQRELMLRDNVSNGVWDWEKLANSFDVGELARVGLDEELGFLYDDVTSLTEDGFNIERAMRAVGKPKTKRGDIIRLGRHVLTCGDATKLEDVAKLMDGEKSSFACCDPPYNIGLDYAKGISTKGKYRGSFSAGNDRKSSSDYRMFIDAAVKSALTAMTKDAHISFWCDENFVGKMQEIFETNGIANKRTCLWIKNNFNMTPQTAFNKVYEPCVYGTIGKPWLRKELKNMNEILNPNVESGNQVVDEILEMINIWLVKRDNVLTYEHPTQKPVALAEKPMKRCTKPGDIVLDLFGGSGSTLIAAEQLNRRAYLMEIDPVFCDVIRRRYEEYIKKR